MSNQEHPAAKAGRFVRAAGLALQRELERRAATATATPAQRELPPPPPPPVPTADLTGRAVFAAFIVSLFAFLLVVLRVEMVLGGGSKHLLRLILAAVMLVEAAVLTSNWRRANQRLVQRVLNRVWGPRAPVSRREKIFARVLRDALTLLGIVFLAAGVFELLLATVGY